MTLPLMQRRFQAAQQAAQQHANGATAAVPAAENAVAGTATDTDALSNEHMVWEMLYNPAYCLSTTETEAA